MQILYPFVHGLNTCTNDYVTESCKRDSSVINNRNRPIASVSGGVKSSPGHKYDKTWLYESTL